MVFKMLLVAGTSIGVQSLAIVNGLEHWQPWIVEFQQSSTKLTVFIGLSKTTDHPQVPEIGTYNYTAYIG